MESKESNIRENHAEKINMSLQFCSPSGIYAGEDFTVYITVENISSEPLYIWNYGVLPSTEFEFRSCYFEQLELSEGTRLERFIFYIKSIKLRIKKEYSEYILKNKLEEPLPLKEPLPWKLSPGESVTHTLMGKTKKSWIFRPDKYNLLIYVDYRDSQEEFYQETKLVEGISVLTSIWTLIGGAIIGGLLGGLSRLIINALGDLKAIWGNLTVIRENVNTIQENTNALEGNISAHLDEISLLETANAPQGNVSALLETANTTLTNANTTLTNANAVLMNANSVGGGEANVLLVNASTNLADVSTILTNANTTLAEKNIILENTSAILTNVNANLTNVNANLTNANAILDKTYNFWNSILVILLSVILSVLAVIALSRKTGAQQFITIQDIWGGVFIGFLVGIFGYAVFTNLVGVPGITP